MTAWEPPRHFATAPGRRRQPLDYGSSPRGAGTHLRYRHHGVLTGGLRPQLDACRQHTAFYYHSLGEYVRHFAGRDAAYVTADGARARRPTAASARVRARARRSPTTSRWATRVRLTPGRARADRRRRRLRDRPFLGVRSDDALYRFYGRDAWGWPVGVAHHLFAGGADATAAERGVAAAGSTASSRPRRWRDGRSTRSSSTSACPPAQLPPEESCRAHGRCPTASRSRAAAIVAGLALEPTETATSIRGDLVTDGPFIETKEVAGRRVRDRGPRPRPRASSWPRMTPIVDGGVEVRPLLGFQVVRGRADRTRRRAGRRRRAPARVGLRARRDGARHARPRRRRGGGAGRLRPGAAHVGARRRPGPARRVADDGRAAHRAQRAAAAAHARDASCRCCSCRTTRRRDDGRDPATVRR